MTTVETKLTTIAEEEEKTGQKILPQLTEEEFVARISTAHTGMLLKAEKLLKGMKAKHAREAVIAALDLKKDYVPVHWVKKTGKNTAVPKKEHVQTVELFMTLQNLINAQFAVIQYQTRQNMLKAAKKAKEQEEQEKQQDTKDVSATEQQGE